MYYTCLKNDYIVVALKFAIIDIQAITLQGGDF